jgi:hypothetical protein
MKNNNMIRIKEIMFYNSKKTLLENVNKSDINEIDRNLIKKISTAAEHADDINKVLGRMNLKIISKSGDVIEDFASLSKNIDKIDGRYLQYLAKDILKSKDLSPELLKSFVNGITSGEGLARQYSKFKTHDDFINYLKKNKYSEETIKLFDETIKQNRAKFKVSGEIKSSASATKSATETAQALSQSKKAEIVAGVTQDVKQGRSYKEILKKYWPLLAPLGVGATAFLISIVNGTGTPPKDTPPPPKPSSGGGSGKKHRMEYRDCSNKSDNFEFGCISPMIAQIQACRGIKPAKGYFGPITRKNLNVDVITKELYDKIMADCGQTSSSDSINVKDITNNPNLAYKPKAQPGQFKVPETPSYLQ